MSSYCFSGPELDYEDTEMNRIKYAPSNGRGSAQGKESKQQQVLNCADTQPSRELAFFHQAFELCARTPAQPHFLHSTPIDSCHPKIVKMHPLLLHPFTPQTSSQAPSKTLERERQKKKMIVPTLKGPNHGEGEGGTPTAWCMSDWVSSGSGTTRAFLHWRAREDSLTQSLMTGKGSGGSRKG